MHQYSMAECSFEIKFQIPEVKIHYVEKTHRVKGLLENRYSAINQLVTTINL